MVRIWGKTSLYIAVFLLLMGGAWFAWRVVHYAKIIREQGVQSFDQAYGRTVVAAEALRALAQGAPGTGNIAGVVGQEPVRGKVGAPVTVVQYADFGCPYSAEVSLVERAMAQIHGENVRFIYRNFPIEDLHPGATEAAVAAECAHEQGKFYSYHDGLYRLKGDLSEENLQSVAQEVGLNMALWQRCRTAGPARTKVEQDIADGLAAGTQSTPTYFVNGVKIEGSIPYAIFDSLLAAFAR